MKRLVTTVILFLTFILLGDVKVNAAETNNAQLQTVEQKGFCWIDQGDHFDVGISFNSNSNVEFKWMSYNLDKKEWVTISDWTSSNWISWYTEDGNYWIHCELRTENGESTDENTICFHYTIDNVKIVGTYANYRNQNEILLGCSANQENVNYSFKIYDIDLKEWFTITDKEKGQWVTWRPLKHNGNYWVHFELYTTDGRLTDTKTYCFAIRNYYPNEVVVGEANYDFHLINEALQFAEDYADKENRVQIKVEPGVYNEQIEILSNPGIDIIGAGSDQTIVSYRGNYPKCVLFTSGDGTFSNIAFINENEEKDSGYALHFETGDAYCPSKILFENCYFESYGSAIGIGFGANCEITFDNCTMKSYDSPAIYLHNNPLPQQYNQHCIMKKCNLITNDDVAIQIDDAANSYGNEQSLLQLTFQDVNVPLGELLFRKNTNDTTSYLNYIPNDDNNIRLAEDSTGSNLNTLVFQRSDMLE